MGLKDYATRQGYRLLQDPRVAELMQNKNLMRLVMQAIRLRGDAEERVDELLESVAHRMNLATKKELREMKRALRRMQNQLSEREER